MEPMQWLGWARDLEKAKPGAQTDLVLGARQAQLAVGDDVFPLHR